MMRLNQKVLQNVVASIKFSLFVKCYLKRTKLIAKQKI